MIEVPPNVIDFASRTESSGWSDIFFPGHSDKIKSRRYEFISLNLELGIFGLEYGEVSHGHPNIDYIGKGYWHSYYFTLEQFLSVVERLRVEGEADFEKLPVYYSAFSYRYNYTELYPNSHYIKPDDEYNLIISKGILSGKLLNKNHIVKLVSSHFNLINILFDNENDFFSHIGKRALAYHRVITNRIISEDRREKE